MKLSERLKNWKTTLLGLVPAIVAVLGFTNILHIDAESLTQQTNDVLNVLMELVSTVTAAILFYKRDAAPENEADGQ